MFKKTRSLSRRLIVIILVVVVLSIAAVGTVSYYLNRENAVRLNGERALSIAKTVALGINTAQYKQIVETGSKNAYWYSLHGYLNTALRENDLIYLYIVHSYDDENVYFVTEGVALDDDVPPYDLNEPESLGNYDEGIVDVFAGQDVISSDIFATDDWGSMVSGMTPIFDEVGDVIGLVGADIAIDDVLASANQFGLMILVMVVAISVLIAVVMGLYLRRVLGRPIADLTQAAHQIANGEVDLDIRVKSDDEIGMLADSFRDMTETIRGQAHTLEAIAEGDLSISVSPRSDKDVVSYALSGTVKSLDSILGQINTLTTQVAAESGQIAASARSLATGASNQSAATEELSATVTEISSQTKQNTSLAEASAQLASDLRQEAAVGFDKLETLIAAVKDIRSASLAISSVLKVIEDVAFQTNILALNASVEAAHAGEYGDGFAVVAKEVQDLSRKTSTSAKQTAELIESTLSKTKQGVVLAEEVHATMETVVKSAAESNRIAEEIAMSSREQMLAIGQVNQGINQVAMVVHENSNVAEKNASVSQEMNKEIESLKGLVARFKTRV